MFKYSSSQHRVSLPCVNLFHFPKTIKHPKNQPFYDKCWLNYCKNTNSSITFDWIIVHLHLALKFVFFFCIKFVPRKLPNDVSAPALSWVLFILRIFEQTKTLAWPEQLDTKRKGMKVWHILQFVLLLLVSISRPVLFCFNVLKQTEENAFNDSLPFSNNSKHETKYCEQVICEKKEEKRERDLQYFKLVKT